MDMAERSSMRRAYVNSKIQTAQAMRAAPIARTVRECTLTHIASAIAAMLENGFSVIFRRFGATLCATVE